MKHIGLSQMYKVKVVGIYGVGVLARLLLARPCAMKCQASMRGGCAMLNLIVHVRIPKRLQNIVINLTRQSADSVCQFGEG